MKKTMFAIVAIAFLQGIQLHAGQFNHNMEVPQQEEVRNFFTAVQEGNLDTVKNFVERNEYFVNSVNQIGSTPLIVAAANGHVEIVQYFLYHVQDRLYYSLRNFANETALTSAAQNGYLDIVHLFISWLNNNNLLNQNEWMVKQALGKAQFFEQHQVVFYLERVIEHYFEALNIEHYFEALNIQHYFEALNIIR